MTQLDRIDIENKEKLSPESAHQAKMLDSSSQEELKGNEKSVDSSAATQEGLTQDPIETPMKDHEEHHKAEGGQLCEAAKKEQAALASIESPDLKLQTIIEKMESALSQGGTPNFKLFWDLRKICLEIFKDNISPAQRATSWAKYRELSKEAKKLKDLFDEQSAFAVEQIDIAVKALESDIETFAEHVAKASEVDLGVVPKSFEAKREEYAFIQKKLSLLNAHAARVNTLRKELIKTEMRIKHKNSFFERLSKVGDKIFPERKELIKQVSDKFEADVRGFVDHFFGGKNEHVPTYYLRDDIKHLQNLAKILTLNSQAFSETRKKLSECWDNLKQMDKDRKKEIQSKRESVKKSTEECLSKIEAVSLSFKEAQISPSECLEKADEVFKELKSLDLGKEELRTIRDRLSSLKKEAQDKIREKQDEKLRHEREKALKKQEAVSELEKRVEDALTGKEMASLSDLKQNALELKESVKDLLGASGKESQDMLKKIRTLDEWVTEKEEEALLNISGEGKDSLKSLRDVLDQKKKRRSEIKEGIEKLRKEAGSSGFDIGKALVQQEQIQIEKERLERADGAIGELEEKIAELKAKLRQNKS